MNRLRRSLAPSSALSNPNSTSRKPRPSGSSSRFGAPFLRSPSTIVPSNPSRPIGLNAQNLGHVIGGRKRVAVAEPDERSMLRARDQRQPWLRARSRTCLRSRRAPGPRGSRRSGQQLVEVVAGDPPGNAGDSASRIWSAYRSRIAPAGRRRFRRGVRLALTIASSSRSLRRCRRSVACRRRAGCSSSSTLSTVLPASSECVPQELLPIIPPSVHRLWVDGSGPNVS